MPLHQAHQRPRGVRRPLVATPRILLQQAQQPALEAGRIEQVQIQARAEDQPDVARLAPEAMLARYDDLPGLLEAMIPRRRRAG